MTAIDRGESAGLPLLVDILDTTHRLYEPNVGAAILEGASFDEVLEIMKSVVD